MSRNKLPPTDAYSPWQIHKVEPGQKVKFVCQSREWEGVEAHWYGNHSIKCPGVDVCDLCVQHIAQVWKGYLLGRALSGGEPEIFQITPLAARTLKTLIDRPEGLLGAIICLERKGKRRNSPLEASIRGFTTVDLEIPFERLERSVAVIFRHYDNLKSPMFPEA